MKNIQKMHTDILTCTISNSTVMLEHAYLSLVWWRCPQLEDYCHTCWWPALTSCTVCCVGGWGGGGRWQWCRRRGGRWKRWWEWWCRWGWGRSLRCQREGPTGGWLKRTWGPRLFGSVGSWGELQSFEKQDLLGHLPIRLSTVHRSQTGSEWPLASNARLCANWARNCYWTSLWHLRGWASRRTSLGIYLKDGFCLIIHIWISI